MVNSGLNPSRETQKTVPLKTRLAATGRFLSQQMQCPAKNGTELLSVTVLLDAGGSKTGQAVIINRRLPGQKLFNGQRVALTGFVQT